MPASNRWNWQAPGRGLYAWRRVFAVAFLVLIPIILFIVLLLPGQSGPDIMWVKHARSPDGKLTAVATHLNWDGPGNNDDEVDIVLRDASGHQAAIVKFADGGRYLGDIRMVWQGNRHLDIGYKDEHPQAQPAKALDTVTTVHLMAQ